MDRSPLILRNSLSHPQKPETVRRRSPASTRTTGPTPRTDDGDEREAKGVLTHGEVPPVSRDTLSAHPDNKVNMRSH